MKIQEELRIALRKALAELIASSVAHFQHDKKLSYHLSEPCGFHTYEILGLLPRAEQPSVQCAAAALSAMSRAPGSSVVRHDGRFTTPAEIERARRFRNERDDAEAVRESGGDEDSLGKRLSRAVTQFGHCVDRFHKLPPRQRAFVAETLEGLVAKVQS